SYHRALLAIGALLATLVLVLLLAFRFGADLNMPGSYGGLELSVIAGCIIIMLMLWRLRNTHFANERTADAIALIATALIGACVAFYVGRFADDTQQNVGINAVLGQVERVIDTHQAAKPCALYLVENPELIKKLVPNEEPDELPDKGPKSLCLAQFLLANPNSINDPELAANYAVLDHKYSREEAQLPEKRLTPQQVVVRYINGMTSTETKKLMRALVD